MASRADVPRRPRSDADATRARIVSVAERLFAEQGIDAVSLIQINREAGQRNRTAVQYHFGSKQGLIDAILDKHRPGIDRDRGTMVDALEARTDPTLRDAVRAVVMPVARKLDDPDGGSAYVSIQAQLLGHPGFPEIAGTAQPLAATARLWRLTDRLAADFSTPLRVPRYLLVTGLLFHSIADYARLEGIGAPAIAGTSRAVFVENLIDALTAILAGVPSEEAFVAAAAVGSGPRED